MLDTVNDHITAVMDVLIGWLLALGTDAAIIGLAVGSAAVLTGVRCFTTNQDLLRRCRSDKRRLRQLAREAKRTGDTEARARYRTTSAMIGMKQLRAEALPLAAALVPIVLLATWGFARLGYRPVAGGEPVALSVYLPVSAAGELAHVVPQDDLTCEEAWLQTVGVDPEGEENGLVRWTLRAAARPEPYRIAVRYKDETVEVDLRAGGRRYEPPLVFFDGPILCAQVELEPVRLFGTVPGFPPLALPPWIVGYLVVVIPAAVLMKRLFGIA